MSSSHFAFSTLPTFFGFQGLAGVDLHLRLAVRLVLAEPAVAGEHVVFAVVGNHDLNAVQEPTRTHPFVGVANHKTVNLPGGGGRINEVVVGVCGATETLSPSDSMAPQYALVPRTSTNLLDWLGIDLETTRCVGPTHPPSVVKNGRRVECQRTCPMSKVSTVKMSMRPVSK